ncbi:LysR family transcriptional regulator [Oceanobacillus locisalsi]|uniref:LysR family transcriptional regulator n=1 Tax=Oceanobacillus locisalsi TaxID=546107 RepID=A0ABW3NKA2_9BACI
MELRHLEYFLMVSKELHFTKAAEELGISQPTLSHQIKILEQEVGYPLFNRVGKKIELTKVGEIVQQEALNVQGSLQSMTSQITAFTKAEIGELKIAVLPGEITDLVSTLCIHFNRLYPNMKVIIQTTDEVEQAVLENQADFGIGFHFDQLDRLQVTKLYEEAFYLISSQNDRRKKVPFETIFDNPIILFPDRHQCRKILDKTSSEMGRQLVPIVETSSIEAILNLVRNGVGHSVVSRTLYEFYDTEDLFFQHIEKPALTRNVYLAMKKNCFVNHSARKYLKLLIQEIERLRFHIEEKEIALLQNALS